MFMNYLKIAFRNLIRFKGYSLINIMGFAIGISCCILISLFLKNEFSYDGFHENRARIFRIVSEYKNNGNTRYHDGMPAPLAPALINEYKNDVKITRFGAGQGDIIKYGNFQTRNNRFELADANVFDVFTIPFLYGNPGSALNDLNTIVISESISKKYFGTNNPIGKILLVGSEDNFQDYKITGVFQDFPTNSHLKFDCLASFQNLYSKQNEGNLTWGASNYETFILLSKGFSVQNLETAIKRIFEKNNSFPAGLVYNYFLQPLTEIHVNLNPGNKLPTERESESIFIFAGIALLILLIACINFINLSTARASIREKEIGVRKVVGAQRLQLVYQFLSESVILSLTAFILAVPIVEGLLPVFNKFADKQLSLFTTDNIYLLFALPVMAVIIGIFAGIYPAFYISSFKPASILRGGFFNHKTNSRTLIRNLLVVTQFVVSIIFIAATLVIHNQLDYISQKNLGYNKDHLVVLPIYDADTKSKYELYKTEILRNASIMSATGTSYLPSGQSYNQNVHFKGSAKGKMDNISWIPVDADFIKTMGLQLTQGSNFQGDSPTKNITYVLNESAIKQIGWKNPIGETMDIIGWGSVIGVIKDFHFRSLHNKIEPLALCLYPEAFQYLHVRVKPENIASTIGFMEKKWKEIFPEKTFEYSFFDEDFDRLYEAEMQLGNIFNFIAILAMLVASLGLLGLANYSIGRRTKEIGIRKILGSSSTNVVTLLIKEFLKWILVANLIAFPVSYYFINKWLEDFAYRINISWWMFVLSGGIALVIALATVSYHAIKAAIANPVESLRYE